ncbi:tail fiber assembly protein [Escherichia coli]|uniref:tail fiber assembly protein n=1 Tax=Escherichia coli TaxID=562 RepID=UPI00388FE296
MTGKCHWLSPEGEFQKWNGTAAGEGYGSRKTVPDPGGGRNKNSLMQVASEHIAPLQDAVDLEIATEKRNLVAGSTEKVSGVAEPC